MQRTYYLLLFFVFTTASCSYAQLTVVDTINFRPSYLEDSIQLIKKRNDHFIDAQGNFCIGFSDLGARRLTDTLWTEYTNANSGIASNYVLVVSQAANNTMWFGTNAGVSVYDGSNWTNYNHANSSIVSDTVTVIEHNGNTHWIGTRNGLSKFDGTIFTNYNTSNSPLPADSILSLLTDQSGNVWIGTMNGLAFFDGVQWTIYNTSSNNIVSNSIYDIETDGAGNVWVATGAQGVYYLINGVFVNYYATRFPSICVYYYEHEINHLAKGNDGFIYFTQSHGESLVKASVNDTALDESKYPYAYLNFKPIINNHLIYFICVSQFNNFFSTTCIVYDLNTSTFNHTTFNNSFHQYDYGIYGPQFPFSATGCDLNVNMVWARILNKGDMHWDPISQTNYYAVPFCNLSSSVYVSSIWLGGLDQSGLLHTAAQTYRQQGANDFYNGPLDTITAQTDSATRANYDKLWKVDQWVINDFRLNFLNGNVSSGTYTIPDIILKWPAQGNGNYSRSLAPFVDYDHDGSYNAYHGDYPLIDGDQMIWWVFNDQGGHYETNGTPFGFELHGKAYGYACPDLTGIDTLFNYTTFYQWKIINRSAETYHDMYVGLWCDFDLGNASDDYVGCDVGNASFFAYNGDPDDDGAAGYGINPPIQNVTVLKGPFANANDGIDNNHNGTIDEQNETIDLSNFISYHSSNGTPIDNPSVAADYYNYLHSNWLDSTHLTYDTLGLNCNYRFPGITDPAFPGQNWTMATVGMSPTDVRGVGSSGPFTIAPGETRTIDFAYIFTRDPNQQISFSTNALYTSYLRNWFKNGAKHPCPHDSFTFIPAAHDTSNALVYPNPAIDHLLINIPQGFINQTIIVYDMQGRVCMDKIRDGNKLDISKLSAGAYFLKIITQEKSYVARFVKMRR